MEDEKLADEIIARLNKLIENPRICEDIARLIGVRVTCSNATREHPTIQAEGGRMGRVMMPTVGFLGVLNGIVGKHEDGPHKGRGYITAIVENEMLQCFKLTSET